MKRVGWSKYLAIAFVMALLLCEPVMAHAAVLHAPAQEPESQFVYLYNLDKDKLVYEKNADTPAYPASLTKIMTCILALENTPNLDTELTVYPNYVQDYLYTYQRTHGDVTLAGMYAGEEMTMRDLLHGMMLHSGNETAMIVANHVAGGAVEDPANQSRFVEMMNTRAKELGATKTRFVNPNGLFDAQQVTTARDMAQITMHALTLPGFMEICTTVNYSVPSTNKNPDGLNWRSTVSMQNSGNAQYYYPYVSGVKTGTLPESGRCLITTASRNGFTYLLVTMGAPYLDAGGIPLERRADFDDHLAIYEWVFDFFRVKSLIEKNRVVTDIPIRLNADKDTLQLVTADRFTDLVPADVDPATSVVMRYDIPEALDAPVHKGDIIGDVILLLYGEEVGRVALLANESIEASQSLVLLEKAKAIVASFWFKFGVILFFLLIILYIVLMIVRNRNRRRQKRTLYKPRRRI